MPASAMGFAVFLIGNDPLDQFLEFDVCIFVIAWSTRLSSILQRSRMVISEAFPNPISNKMTVVASCFWPM
jgi:hypothetical protein